MLCILIKNGKYYFSHWYWVNLKQKLHLLNNRLRAQTNLHTSSNSAKVSSVICISLARLIRFTPVLFLSMSSPSIVARISSLKFLIEITEENSRELCLLKCAAIFFGFAICKSCEYKYHFDWMNGFVAIFLANHRRQKNWRLNVFLTEAQEEVSITNLITLLERWRLFCLRVPWNNVFAAIQLASR